MLEIVQLPALSDNYIYLLHDADSGETAAVDPTVAELVLAVLNDRGWRLTHLLNTHHHGDHVGGNRELKRATGCRVVGSAKDRTRIPGIDQGVSEGERVRLGASEALVMEVSGHTVGHIAFWFQDEKALFCGDTLFSLGCGRLFEGTARQMWESLDKIRALPGDTRVYCAHEYTQENGRFAMTVEPENPALQARLEEVANAREARRPTVPSLLAEEMAANPFLRPESAEMRLRLGLAEAPNWQVFEAVRRLKDRF
jgi:hydroxyacylglutathione hydrolase